MNNINNVTATSSIQTTMDDNSADSSYDDKVLSYLQQQQPDETLNSLLTHMRALSPDKPVTLQKLYSALLTADGQMRKDQEYQAYTDKTLDDLAIRLSGLNMFFIDMENNNVSQSSDDDDDDDYTF